MSVTATPGFSQGGGGSAFGSGIGILGGRLGGAQFGIIAVGIDAGATNLMRSLSANALLTEKNIDKAGRNIAAFGGVAQGMIASIGIMTAGIGAAALVVAEFDQTLARIAAITGSDVEDVFETVGKNAIRLSEDFGISAGRIADAARQFAQAGVGIKDIDVALESVIEFSTIVGGDLTRSVDLAVKVMRGFGKTSADMASIMNTMTFAITQSPTTINDLQLAFKQITPVAGQLGVKLESVAAAIAAVSRGGLAGETGGTSLATGLLKLLDPSKEVQQEFGNLINIFRGTLQATGDIATGFEAFVEAQGVSLLDLTENVEDLRNAFTGTDEEIEANVEAMAKLDDRFKVIDNIIKIFTVRSTKAWLNFSSQAAQAKADTLGMELQLVQTSEAAEKAITNIGNQAARLRTQLVAGLLGSDFSKNLAFAFKEVADSGVVSEIGDEMSDALNNALLDLTEELPIIVDLIKELVPAMGTFAEAAATSADALGGLVALFNALPDSITQTVISLALLNAMFGKPIKKGFEQVDAIKEEIRMKEFRNFKKQMTAELAEFNRTKQAEIDAEKAKADRIKQIRQQEMDDKAIEGRILSDATTGNRRVSEDAKFELKQRIDRKTDDIDAERERQAILKDRMAILNEEADVEDIAIERRRLIVDSIKDEQNVIKGRMASRNADVAAMREMMAGKKIDLKLQKQLIDSSANVIAANNKEIDSRRKVLTSVMDLRQAAADEDVDAIRRIKRRESLSLAMDDLGLTTRDFVNLSMDDDELDQFRDRVRLMEMENKGRQQGISLLRGEINSQSEMKDIVDLRAKTNDKLNKLDDQAIKAKGRSIDLINGNARAEKLSNKEKRLANNITRSQIRESQKRQRELTKELKNLNRLSTQIARKKVIDDRSLDSLRQNAAAREEVIRKLHREEQAINASRRALEAERKSIVRNTQSHLAAVEAGRTSPNPAAIAGGAGFVAAAGKAKQGLVGSVAKKVFSKAAISAAARTVFAFIGGPVGIALTVISFLPLLKSLRRENKKTTDSFKAMREEWELLNGNIDDTTKDLIGLAEQQERFNKTSLFLGTTVIDEEDGTQTRDESFALDLSSLSQKARQEVIKRAQEQNVEILQLNSELYEKLSEEERARLEEFIQSKEKERDVTDETAQIHIKQVALSTSIVGAFWQKLWIGIKNGAKLAFAGIGFGLVKAVEVMWETAVKFAGGLVGTWGHLNKQLAPVYAGISASFEFIFGELPQRLWNNSINAMIKQFNKLIKGLNKLPGVSVSLLKEISAGQKESFEEIFEKHRAGLEEFANFVIGKGDAAITYDADFLDHTFEEYVNILGGLEEAVAAGEIGQEEANKAIDDYLVAVKEAADATMRSKEVTSLLMDNLSNFGAIGKRLEKVSFETVDGIQRTTSAFHDIGATGFRLSKTLGEFEKFFNLKLQREIANEVIDVFTAIGESAPPNFLKVVGLLETEMVEAAREIASNFSAAGFEPREFINAIAKALDSPRFEQNNNIVVRISGASGLNAEEAAKFADEVITEMNNRQRLAGAQ